MAPGTIIIVSRPRELAGEYVTLSNACEVTATGCDFTEKPKQPKFKGWQPKEPRRFPVAPRELR